MLSGMQCPNALRTSLADTPESCSRQSYIEHGAFFPDGRSLGTLSGASIREGTCPGGEAGACVLPSYRCQKILPHSAGISG